ncbi:MAG TPA: hypothetical protein VFK47_14925, partial [Ktedonobacteraceae bacterium]|nr:hypothetical protein [Ktedonobacteraceae bacterium]
NEAQAKQQQHAQFETPYVSEQINPSALEMLVATTRTSFAQNDVPAADSSGAAFGQNDEQALPAHIPFVQNDALVSPSLSAAVQNNVPITPPLHLPMRQDTKEPVYPLRAAIPGNERLPIGQSDVARDDTDIPSFPRVYAEMQEETQSLAAQTSSLRELVHQLRGAISIVEDQRKEFKGFLDGSKDALDRMEDWAGQVMGLNLRNSPEHVRRYLPLSVMWASNTKLKKVLDQLKIVTGGVEMTDEQLHTILAQLSTSLEACGKAFQQSEAQANGAAYILAQEAGWTPWEMQRLQDRADVRERVTFERRGDPATLRAEIEAQVREELRREYEISIREEIRQEYENRAITLAA